MNFRRITRFDTTLRDGEQAPGIALRPDEKVEVDQGAAVSIHELVQEVTVA